MRTVVILVLCCFLGTPFLHATKNSITNTSSTNAEPNKGDVFDIIYKVNTYWQQTNPNHGRPFWDRAAYHTANMAVYEVTKDLSFLEYSIDFAEKNNWKGATSDNKENWKYGYGETMDHVLFGDWQTCFQVFADLYNIQPADNKIARAREVMEYEMSTSNIDYWWWVDALYMVMPVMTRLYKITENPLYLEKLHEYWQYTNSIMYDEEEGLYYRDANYIYPAHKTNSGKKDFWSRGNGWAFAAFAQVLKDLPENDSYRNTYIRHYQKMAAKLLETQQAEGYWTRSVIDPDYVPGYETSGSAFFTYGLLWGINNGYLSEETYGEAAQKGWSYLSAIALQDNGKIGYVQPIGGSAIPGQYIDINSTADFGVGAFLLAACEMYKYVGGDTSKPLLRLSSIQLLDGTRVQLVFNNILDATSAQNINNYTINGQVIDGVIDFDGKRTVTISLSQTLDYGQYTLAIKDLISQMGVVIDGITSRSFLLSVPLTPCESGITVTAISGLYGNKPENTIDSNLNSRWNGQQKQDWIKYDLGKQREIYAADIAFYRGDEQLNYFDIEVSSDDENYTSALTNGVSSGLTSEMERFSFAPQNARYVRIVCNGNSVDNSSGLTEVRIRYSDSELLNNISLPSKVYTDIIMPLGVIWSSSDAAVLSPSGLIGVLLKDSLVTLTARSGVQTKDFQATVAARDVLKNNNIIHYTFNEEDQFTDGKETYLKDSSEKENHARIYGNALINGTLDLTANTQNGFSNNGYLMAPDGLLDNLRSYSVLAKINAKHLNKLPRMYDFGTAYSNSTFGCLNALSVGMKYNGETTIYINSSQQVSTSMDTYLGFTFDALSKTSNIYINGETTATGTIKTEPYQLSLIAPNTRNYIGRTQWWDSSVASSNIDFCGTMDDFYVFDIALTKDEIMQIQNLKNSGLETIQKESRIALYPNPVKCGDAIFITSQNQSRSNYCIQIINQQGMITSSKQVNSLPASVGKINQAGFYFVKITNDLQQANILKLIVK